MRALQGEAEIKGRAEVKGVPVVILEWPLPDKKAVGRAFRGYNDLTKDGGKLRVHVAPQLGHALPLIECVATGETIAKRMEAEDFIETAAGIFIPRHFSQHSYDQDGLVYWESYQVKSVEKVNEAIPEEDFVIDVPHGAALSDQRGEHAASYRVGQDVATLPTDLGDVIAGMPQAPPPPLLTRWTAITVGVGIGVVLLGAYYMVRRRMRRHAA